MFRQDPAITDANMKQQTVWNAFKHLQCLFRGGNDKGGWRAAPELFKDDEECLSSVPGAVNLSPAWFEQAQDVCGF
jgi:hypothetical protein